MSIFIPVVSTIEIPSDHATFSGAAVSSTINLPAPRNLAGWFSIDTLNRLTVGFVVPKSGENSLLAVKRRVENELGTAAQNLTLTTGQGIFGFETGQNPRPASGYFMIVLERVLDRTVTPTLTGIRQLSGEVGLSSVGAHGDFGVDLKEIDRTGSPRKSLDAPLSMRRLAAVRNEASPRQHFRFLYPADVSPLYDPAGFAALFLEQQAPLADIQAAATGSEVASFSGFKAASEARSAGRKRSSRQATSNFDSATPAAGL